MKAGSIQASLTKWFVVQSLIGLSVACLGVYCVTRWSFEVKHDAEFARHVDLVRHVVQETRDPTQLPMLRINLDEYFASHPEIAAGLWAGGQPIYASQRPTGTSDWITRATPLDNVTLRGQPVEVRLALDISRENALLQRLGWTLVGAAGLGSLFISFTGAWLVRRGLKPLKRLADQTAAAGPGHPGMRVDASTYASELWPWIGQFNALLQRVEGAYAQLDAFNADVAHELRTPLSNMIAQVEVELGHTRSAGELREVLSSHLEEARRLSSIVTDMLLLSRADRGAKARRTNAAGLAEQVEAVAEFYEASLEEAQITLRVVGDAAVRVDTGLIRRAISNLVSNAVRYATRGTEILVEIEQAPALARITVVNQGPAIAAEALPRIFERFYRADLSRTGSSSHHGLGLSIVAAIARMHGGETFAESRQGQTRIGLSIADELPPLA